MSAAESTSGRAARARAESTTLLSSSKKSNEGAEAGLSVPTPTRAPAARSSASGATPQPSAPFERGQWAIPVPVERAARSPPRRGRRSAPRRRSARAGRAPPAVACRSCPAARPADSCNRPRRQSREQVVELGAALGDVRRDRQAQLGTGLVELERDRVGRVRRDPGSHGSEKASPARSRMLGEMSECGLRVRSEDFEVDRSRADRAPRTQRRPHRCSCSHPRSSRPRRDTTRHRASRSRRTPPSRCGPSAGCAA